jgi:hypothetical protein
MNTDVCKPTACCAEMTKPGRRDPRLSTPNWFCGILGKGIPVLAARCAPAPTTSLSAAVLVVDFPWS